MFFAELLDVYPCLTQDYDALDDMMSYFYERNPRFDHRSFLLAAGFEAEEIEEIWGYRKEKLMGYYKGNQDGTLRTARLPFHCCSLDDADLAQLRDVVKAHNREIQKQCRLLHIQLQLGSTRKSRRKPTDALIRIMPRTTSSSLEAAWK